MLETQLAHFWITVHSVEEGWEKALISVLTLFCSRVYDEREMQPQKKAKKGSIWLGSGGQVQETESENGPASSQQVKRASVSSSGK